MSKSPPQGRWVMALKRQTPGAVWRTYRQRGRWETLLQGSPAGQSAPEKFCFSILLRGPCVSSKFQLSRVKLVLILNLMSPPSRTQLSPPSSPHPAPPQLPLSSPYPVLTPSSPRPSFHPSSLFSPKLFPRYDSSTKRRIASQLESGT